MDIQQNTEFILNKIDSIMTQATPYLEKGSEAVVKYKVDEIIYSSVSSLLICHFVFIVGLFSAIFAGKKINNSHDLYIPLTIVGGGVSAISFLFCLLFWASTFPKLLLAINNPELYTIFNLLGK